MDAETSERGETPEPISVAPDQSSRGSISTEDPYAFSMACWIESDPDGATVVRVHFLANDPPVEPPDEFGRVDDPVDRLDLTAGELQLRLLAGNQELRPTEFTESCCWICMSGVMQAQFDYSFDADEVRQQQIEQIAVDFQGERFLFRPATTRNEADWRLTRKKPELRTVDGPPPYSGPLSR